MPDNSDKGFSVGGRAEEPENPQETVEKIAEDLEVTNLSELTQTELQELRSRLSEVEGLRGVSIGGGEPVTRAGSIDRQSRRRVTVQDPGIGEDVKKEIEEISDQSQLLKALINQNISIERSLKTANDLLADVVEATVRGRMLNVKETDSIEFSDAKSPRDLVDDNDVSTAEVLVKANPKNSGALFVGTSSVSVDSGFRIEPGASQMLPVDAFDGEIKIVSEKSGDEYSYLALGR